MQRKGGDKGGAKDEEEGRSSGIASSAEDDTDFYKRIERSYYPPPRNGWNPTTVVLVAIMLLSLCFAWYQTQQVNDSRRQIAELTLTMSTRATEVAMHAHGNKQRLERVEEGKKRADEKVAELQGEVSKLHDEVTQLRHDLHEEQVKYSRMQRDNQDLHKKIKVKSAELKVLEDQTQMFGREMAQLTKTIHTLQGEVADEDAIGDYEALYKKQEAQQKRFKSGGVPPLASHAKGQGAGFTHAKPGGHKAAKDASGYEETASTKGDIDKGQASIMTIYHDDEVHDVY